MEGKMSWFSNFTLNGLLSRFPEIIKEIKDKYTFAALACLFIGVALLLMILIFREPILIGITFVYGITILAVFAYEVIKIDAAFRLREGKTKQHGHRPKARN
jgi:hypothetical protein